MPLDDTALVRLERVEHKLEEMHTGIKDIRRLIHGEDHSPGLLERVDENRMILMGPPGQSGLVGRVEVLWKTYVFLWCTLSAAAGSVMTWVITKLI